MKKYFISGFIFYLLLYLSGCYSMQEVTKEEFSPAPDYPELYIKIKNNEYIFEEGNYIFRNDTIYGKEEIKFINNPIELFEGTISNSDVEYIQTSKSGNIVFVTTKDKEFIFKNEESSYSVKNDTIYGKGKYRLKGKYLPTYYKNQSQVNISLNDVEEIQVNKFDLSSTILWSLLAVATVALIIWMATSFKLNISDEDVWREIGNNHQ